MTNDAHWAKLVMIEAFNTSPSLLHVYMVCEHPPRYDLLNAREKIHKKILTKKFHAKKKSFCLPAGFELTALQNFASWARKTYALTVLAMTTYGTKWYHYKLSIYRIFEAEL